MDPMNTPETSESSEKNIPDIIMGEVRVKTTITLWEVIMERRMWLKKIKFFKKDTWNIWVIPGWWQGDILYFISPAFVGDNREIHLYRGWKKIGKMMLKLKNDAVGENYIRDRIEKNDHGIWFTDKEVPDISSVPSSGDFYLPGRDKNIVNYMELRNKEKRGLFFKKFTEFNELVLTWYIDQTIAENGGYSLQIMYAWWLPNVYYRLTGLYSCIPILWPRPGMNTDLSVQTLLENEWVIGWEILGVFPEPTPPSIIA